MFAMAPARVCSWLKIEMHKLASIDNSWHTALAAAKSAGALDVVYKLDAMIGLVPQQDLQEQQQQGNQPGHPAAGGSGTSNSSSDRQSCTGPLAGGGLAFSGPALGRVFKPDLALKAELHDIKVKQRQRLALMQLPVPTTADADAAVKAGVVAPCPGLASAAGVGVRLFGLPDPSCGGVPEGCVAVRPEVVPPSGWAVIYRWVMRLPCQQQR